MASADDEPGHLFSITHSDHAQMLMSIVPVAMIVIDTGGIIRAFSKAAEETFGYGEAEVLGRNVAILMGKPHRARHDDYIARYLATGEKRIMGGPRLENARHADGHTFPMELTIGETWYEGAHFFVGFVRPLGKPEFEQRQIGAMLTELAHTSRVAAMGALATAIAHELNQPLTSIANYAEGLRTMIGQGPDFEGREHCLEILDKCCGQAIRSGQLLHRLREFVKGGEPHREAASAAHLINEALSLALINGYRKSIHVDTVLDDDLPCLNVDALQVQQVLFNLLRNSFEAMDSQPGERHDLVIHARRGEGGLVHISVEDSGPGIDPEIAEIVFNSFVTTKAGGMGVGLAICKQIVEAHGGAIWADNASALGGAAFHLTLPTTESNGVGHA